MFIQISFDGYRAFPSRRLRAPNSPLQRLDIAPVTVILGQNNVGKSTVLALVAQVLHGLGGDSGIPFVVGGRKLAESFLDLLPGRGRLNMLEIEVDLTIAGNDHNLHIHLAPYGDQTAGDDMPWVIRLEWDGKVVEGQPAPLKGSLRDSLGLSTADCDFLRLAAQDSVWLGPYRTLPDAEVPETPSIRSGPLLTSDGSGTVEGLRRDADVFEAVNGWFRAHADLQLRWDVTLGKACLMARRSGADAWVGIRDAGSGIHQLLPIVFLAYWRKTRGGAPGRIDMIEQPELHLHDALHPALADLMLYLGTGEGRVHVETHSEGLLLRLRRRVAEDLPANNVSISFVETIGTGSPSGARIRQVGLSADGEIRDWPDGVFLKTFEELRALRLAQRKRRPDGARGIL